MHTPDRRNPFNPAIPDNFALGLSATFHIQKQICNLSLAGQFPAVVIKHQTGAIAFFPGSRAVEYRPTSQTPARGLFGEEKR